MGIDLNCGEWEGDRRILRAWWKTEIKHMHEQSCMYGRIVITAALKPPLSNTLHACGQQKAYVRLFAGLSSSS